MALIGILMNAAGEIFKIFFPIYVVIVLNLPVYYLGFFLSIIGFMHVFQFYFGRISDTISSEFGVLLGVFISSLSMVFLPYIGSNIFSLVILLIIYGIGNSIWNVNAWSLMSIIAKEKNIQGEIIGSYYSLAMLGVFFATLISAYFVSTFGITATIQFFAIAIFLANIFVYFIFKPVFLTSKAKSPFSKYLKKHL